MSLRLADTQGEILVRTGRPVFRGRAKSDDKTADLLAALRQAEAERDARTAFLSYVVHELRTPLSAVVGMADLLKESQLSPDQRDMIGIMRRSAQHLVGVVSNALELARLDAGKVELELRPFEPITCAEESLDLVAAAAAEKRLDLAYLVEANVPPLLLGDATRIRQVLVNLLGNAVKFTDQGEVVVRIGTRALPGGLYELHGSVSDTGPGIPAERLDDVFREFTQGDVTTSHRHGGSGLGLSISRRLVEMMGGRIWVDSAVGHGSIFHFTIVAGSAGGETASTARDPGLAGKRVLIVDSNPALAEILCETLSRWGVSACTATDAIEALACLQSSDGCDAVLLDGRVTDRRAFAAAIRKLPGGEALPLILLTTFGAKGLDETLAGTGGRARFAAYLSKPVRVARLHETLVRVLCGGQTAAAATPATALRGGSIPAPRTVSPQAAAGAGGTRSSRLPARPSLLPFRPEAPQEPAPQAPLDLKGARVLVADDDPAGCDVLERMLRAEGVEVVTVADGVAALREVDRFDPDVILLDVTMPGLDGFEACRLLKENERTRLTPVVMVTGLDVRTHRIRGIEAGADDIVQKPWERSELLARVRSLVRVKRFTSHLDHVEAVLVAMAQCMESRDPHTQGHCGRLSDYASRLGRRIGLDEADVNALRLGGIVHDIGKVAVPDAILFKAGPLSPEEWAVMREHPVEGERICAGLSAFRRVLPIIRHHHERLDGSGYPDALKGDDIPVTARVLQIVDIYDALTTRRSYKQAMSPAQALDVLQQEVDRGWRDGRIFSAFRDLVIQGQEVLS